ncbi:MAG: type II secretion system F family protein [Candidatus Omnitrophica bacterium]|nr:type II secretion system F family protein [Candidatus Omnitrophota bacterium]
MEKFNYVAVKKDGSDIKGVVEAVHLNDALTKIKAMGYFPSKVLPETKNKKKESLAAALLGRLNFLKVSATKIKDIDLVIFTRQLSVLLDAGLSLVRGLHALQKQSRFKSMNQIISDIVDMIESGRAFSDALAHYPETFSKVYINIVKAGETGGAMDQVLRRLADFLERNFKLKQRIKAALIYPSLVLTVSVAILILIIVFVIPKFMEMFQDTGIALPFLTLTVMSLSDFMLTKWYVFVGGIGLLIGFYKILLRNFTFRKYIDNLKLNIPVIGSLTQKIIAARFSRTLSTLLSGGVPILRALELTKEVSDNEVVATAIADVSEHVREGGFISKVLEHNPAFPQLMVNMIAVGEESGALDKMLAKVADTYDEEVDVTANSLTSLLEPFLVIIMGGVVLLIVLAMFLPLLTLIQSLT